MALFLAAQEQLPILVVFMLLTRVQKRLETYTDLRLGLAVAEIWGAGRGGSCHASKMAGKYVFKWQRKRSQVGWKKAWGQKQWSVIAERWQTWSTDFLTPPSSTQWIAKNLGIAKMWKWKSYLWKTKNYFFSSFWRHLLLNLYSTIHFLRAEVQRSPEWNAHLQPIRGCPATWGCLLCHSSSAWPSLPCAKAKTLPALPSTKQQSMTPALVLCELCCGVLGIQLPCQPDDTVLPFCELHCADSSLLVPARIYFFPNSITCFIMLSWTI